jgi:hypothetical protein
MVLLATEFSSKSDCLKAMMEYVGIEKRLVQGSMEGSFPICNLISCGNTCIG